jgi:hypothetical protein
MRVEGSVRTYHQAFRTTRHTCPSQEEAILEFTHNGALHEMSETSWKDSEKVLFRLSFREADDY